MRKWLHYGLLLAGAFCFLAGVIVILVGYLRYLDMYDTYKLEICKIINRTSISIQLLNSGYHKWFVVKSAMDYPIEIPCYVASSTINRSIVVYDLEIEPYSDLTSLVVGLSFLSGCLIILVGFITIGIIQRRRRKAYEDMLEIPSDFRYQDSPLYHQEVEDNFQGVKHKFEEAQRFLWRNKPRIRENTFDRLRQEQIVAMMGENSVKIKFQQDVYDLLIKL